MSYIQASWTNSIKQNRSTINFSSMLVLSLLTDALLLVGRSFCNFSLLYPVPKDPECCSSSVCVLKYLDTKEMLRNILPDPALSVFTVTHDGTALSIPSLSLVTFSVCHESAIDVRKARLELEDQQYDFKT